MATTLQEPRVAAVLDRMYTESKNQMSRLRDRGSDFNRPMTTAGTHRGDERVLHPGDPGSRPAAVFTGAGDPSDHGRRIRDVLRHFRHSPGAAVRDNGTGRVVTTELSDTKIAAAKQTFAETGLDDVITILEGDALSTLESWTARSISSCSTAGRTCTYR